MEVQNAREQWMWELHCGATQRISDVHLHVRIGERIVRIQGRVDY